MPPRVVKRGGGAARRGGRVTRSAVKAQTPPVESADDESVNIGEVSVSDAVEAKEEETPEVDEEENRLDDDSEAAANPDNVVTPQSKIL